ncbi:GFA family protein [Acinetobacter silvestris]|uniref:Aldehyde-activating protein n=1 Tax=Acinetobacter silvestris TaxID=1977882 RepID=A0A1Y3CN02_9GAMM|nr:GFA family protein [Acinetobacter silvestris]OTG66501.1 aldehyde-activating protein [Acinetobacter silvestris]
MYTASCLCGAVQFKINTEISEVFVCHCQQCQKAQGSAFAAIAVIQTKDLKIIKGQDSFGEYFSTENKKRVFCKNCASPLFSARLDLPDVIRLRVGIINEPLNAKIGAHAYTTYKAAWLGIVDHPTQFSEGQS